MKPNIPLLEEAYAILDGIPDERIDLRVIWKDPNHGPVSPHNCGALACGIGWLGLHPRFQALGLVNEGSAVAISWRDTPRYYAPAGAGIFGITTEQAGDLFMAMTYDRAQGESDKQLLLRRFRKLLVELKIFSKGNL